MTSKEVNSISTKHLLQNKILFQKMERGKMCDKVISPFCSVGYCTFKDNCCKEHPKRDCCNSSWPKKCVIKDIGNNVNMENFVKDIKKRSNL